MSGYTQANRTLSVTTPLGADVLLLESFTGSEEMSRLFHFELSFLSENDAIAATDIVGKAITWQVNQADSDPRYFNGIVTRFSAGIASPNGMRKYRAEVFPWLWFLTRTADCRIFQAQTTPDIIQQIFSDLGFSDFTVSLSATYAQWDYCVQYRETDFDFISRLMEQEGIFYFFKHESGKHTLVLSDQTSAYLDCVESQVECHTIAPPGAAIAAGIINGWEHLYEFRTGKWAQTDYNFETPSTSLRSNVNTLVQMPGNDKYEVFEYPGEYLVKADGDANTKIRMEGEEVAYNVVQAKGTCRTFILAGKFTLSYHNCESEKAAYVITSIKHWGIEASLIPGGSKDPPYSNTFECIPADIVFRPARITPRSLVRGPQTAVVVGPSGEEIYTDKYGRVKVQFFWDRVGANDEKSSCWIRVAQGWAGANWGMIFLPRIGQEVLVDFLEGNPDRPLITGCVYNANQMPPYTLPDNQTQSTIKSRSSKSGTSENFNELRFEDLKDSEEVYFHAERDFNRVVENNDTLKVGMDKKDPGDQTIEIYNNRTETVHNGDESVTIEKGARTVTVKEKDDTHLVNKGNRVVTVDQGNDTHTISQGNRVVEIKQGNDTLTITQGDQSVTITAGKSTVEAGTSIELKVGQNSIKIDQQGITIAGMQVSINGQTKTEVKGAMMDVNASGILNVKGSMVNIN
jgi:type VI secretion system secreted protein VgrG